MTDSTEQRKRLEQSSQIYATEAGRINRDVASTHTTEVIKLKKLLGGKALQLGLGDGFIAEQLAASYEELLVLEGSQVVIDTFYNPKFGYKVIQTFFEDYENSSYFGVLLGNHILEHVDDPRAILKKVLRSLKPGGKAIFTVPNADSLHRRIGVEMGLLESRNSLHSQDLQLGHKRVYTLQELQLDLKSSGFTILESFGYIIKLVSNAQMKDWPKELLSAIYKVSLTAPPEICSNIGVICTK